MSLKMSLSILLQQINSDFDLQSGKIKKQIKSDAKTKEKYA